MPRRDEADIPRTIKWAVTSLKPRRWRLLQQCTSKENFEALKTSIHHNFVWLVGHRLNASGPELGLLFPDPLSIIVSQGIWRIVFLWLIGVLRHTSTDESMRGTDHSKKWHTHKMYGAAWCHVVPADCFNNPVNPSMTQTKTLLPLRWRWTPGLSLKEPIRLYQRRLLSCTQKRFQPTYMQVLWNCKFSLHLAYETYLTWQILDSTMDSLWLVRCQQLGIMLDL